jgi:hypothetical protein
MHNDEDCCWMAMGMEHETSSPIIRSLSADLIHSHSLPSTPLNAVVADDPRDPTPHLKNAQHEKYGRWKWTLFYYNRQPHCHTITTSMGATMITYPRTEAHTPHTFRPIRRATLINSIFVFIINLRLLYCSQKNKSASKEKERQKNKLRLPLFVKNKGIRANRGRGKQK